MVAQIDPGAEPPLALPKPPPQGVPKEIQKLEGRDQAEMKSLLPGTLLSREPRRGLRADAIDELLGPGGMDTIGPPKPELTEELGRPVEAGDRVVEAVPRGTANCGLEKLVEKRATRNVFGAPLFFAFEEPLAAADVSEWAAELGSQTGVETDEPESFVVVEAIPGGFYQTAEAEGSGALPRPVARAPGSPRRGRRSPPHSRTVR